MSCERYIRSRLLTAVCAILLILPSLLLQSQIKAPVKYFKVKENTMIIGVSRDIPGATLDSFMAKYNLGDVGLNMLLRQGKDDSLVLLGWYVDKSDPTLFIVRKPLEKAVTLPGEAGTTIFSPIPTPDTWRKVGGNIVIYGINDFEKGFSFRSADGIVYFELKGFGGAHRVRLAGNFTNWQHGAFSMTPTDGGWVVAVKLTPGKYYYKFIINDNQWITDPRNKQSENDGKGNKNSVYFVTNKRFELPGYGSAHEVFVAGDFNNWAKDKLPMHRSGNGWALDMYLEPGTHSYEFIVDGKIVKANHGSKGQVAIGNSHEFKLKGFDRAKKVVVAGNFNDWKKDELEMERTADGWKVSYVLGPGNYQYKFIVDGRWITDPANPSVVVDKKGNRNSFVVIGANYKFRLKGFDSAREVFLAGTFNEWSPVGLPMKKEGSEWVCTVYLGPGKHLYKFVVDGKWIRDPANKNWEENEFNTGNSILWIEEEV